MNQLILESCIVTASSLIIALIIIPFLARVSNRIGLIDSPGERKVHINTTPVVGGMAIITSTLISLLLSKTTLQLIAQYPVMLSAGLILFLTGIWDDRKNISPMLRLTLQLLCAAAVAASGIRISSLHGLFGIGEIGIVWQYGFSIIIIAGVTNAFNLIDGIDGLAGGLALTGIIAMATLSLLLKAYGLFILFAALTGAIIAFLKHNFFPARIFMGDAGSLLLGFLLPAAGIILVEKAQAVNAIDKTYVILVVITVLSIPTVDSLRVYISRMMRGVSPAKADKTHLHHLLLNLGYSHAKATLVICSVNILLLLTTLVLYHFAGIYSAILGMVTVIFFLYHAIRLPGRTSPNVEGSF